MVSSALLDFLKAQQTSCSNGAKTLTRRRTINVPTGNSVSHAEVSDELIQPATTSRPSNIVEPVLEPPKQKERILSDTSDKYINFVQFLSK
jgi:hypothetical protein